MLKRMGKALVAAAMCVGASGIGTNAAKADEDPSKWIVSGTLTGASNYYFRGISQTDHLPAIQGSFDVEYQMTKPFGFFAGIWASNIDFNDGDDAHIEIDFYGGFKGEIKGFSWTLQFIYYHYPGAESGSNYDYFEINPSIGYDFGFASFTIGMNISPDYFASSGVGIYAYGEASVPLPIRVLKDFKPTLNLSIGHQWIDNNAAFGTPDYLTWSVGLSFEIKGFELSISYVDTDLGRGGCFGGADLCGAGALFTVSRTF